MKELVYPAGLILIPLAYNTYVQSPKLGLIQKTLDAHTAILDACSQKLDAHSKKLDVLVGCHAV